MQAIIQLKYNENLQQIEKEEKNRFLRYLLEEIGLPIQEFWKADELTLSIEQKMKLRNTLSNYAIQVIDDSDGYLAVYVEKELVGEWRRCNYKLKRDLGQIDPKKQLYLEMEINCWSLFEEQEEPT
jgi:hypothetical protein